jgi:hypothetical protein
MQFITMAACTTINEFLNLQSITTKAQAIGLNQFGIKTSEASCISVTHHPRVV